MATFTASLSGSSVVNGSKNWTISDADVQTLIDYMKTKFSSSGGPTLTNGQALVAWMQDFVDQTRNEIRSRAFDQQKQAAIDAVVVNPIVFT